MENRQNNMVEYESKDNNKKILLTILAGVVVLGGLIWWVRQAQNPQQILVSPTPTSDAEAAAINADVDAISVDDLNAELDAIDKDLQGL
mgnify:CR=1 FL=1